IALADLAIGRRFPTGPTDNSAADDDFSEVVAGEEELDAFELAEELFEAAVIEYVAGGAQASFSYEEILRVLNAEFVRLDLLHLIVHGEKGEEVGFRLHDVSQPVHGRVQQRRPHELHGVPHQNAVE